MPAIPWRWRLATLLVYLGLTFAATGRRVSVVALIVWWMFGLVLAGWTGFGFADQTYDEE